MAHHNTPSNPGKQNPFTTPSGTTGKTEEKNNVSRKEQYSSNHNGGMKGEAKMSGAQEADRDDDGFEDTDTTTQSIKI